MVHADGPEPSWLTIMCPKSSVPHGPVLGIELDA